MSATEFDLIGACIELRKIAEANGHYTAGLSRVIDKSGRKVQELTLGELLAFDKEYSAVFNRIHSCTTAKRGEAA